MTGVANLVDLCLSIRYPSAASAPHSNLLVISSVTDIEFKLATHIKEYFRDSIKSASAAGSVASAAAVETKMKRKSEEPDDNMGFGLFD